MFWSPILAIFRDATIGDQNMQEAMLIIIQ
jgi:hypothetical protein